MRNMDIYGLICVGVALGQPVAAHWWLFPSAGAGSAGCRDKNSGTRASQLASAAASDRPEP
jgi:hypothetical protein